MVFASHAAQGDEEVEGLQLGVLAIAAALERDIDFVLYLLEHVGTDVRR